MTHQAPTKSSAARSAACAALALGAFAASVHAQSFNVKPGAWEMTVTTSGHLIAPDELRKMPADRRAAVEKQAMDARAPQTRKACIRKEDLDEDRFMRTQDPNCSAKTASRSPTKLTMTTRCTGAMASTGTMTFEARTPESVAGSIDPERGASTKFHIAIVGRWLGASCDGIEPDPATPARK